MEPPPEQQSGQVGQRWKGNDWGYPHTDAELNPSTWARVRGQQRRKLQNRAVATVREQTIFHGHWVDFDQFFFPGR